MIFPFKKSSVRVELDVSTREDSVDMDAESTSTITIPIRISEREFNIVGIIASYTIPPCPFLMASESNSLAKPPRK